MKRILLLSALLSAHVWADTTYYDTVTWDFGSSLIVNSGITAKFMPGSTVDATGATLVGFPGGTGASSFIGLTDAPHSYSGQAGNFVAVNPGATGLVFVPPPSGGGGGGTVTNFTAGTLSPLFTTAVTNPSTTPALAFSLSTVGAGLFFGNETGVTTFPHYVQPSFANLSGDFALTQTPSLAAGSLIGRTSASAGDWQPITVGTGLSLVGTTLSASAGNVSNSGTPLADQLPIWVDATHLKGVRGVTGGTVGQVLKKLSSTDYDWGWAADLAGGGGGAAVFTDLGDVPSSYFGAASKLVAVNSAGTGLEFITPPAGGVTSVFGRTGAVVAASGDYSAFYQPLDSDLTAIAALTTDPFGRGLLPLTTAAAVRTYIGAGTSSFDGTFTSLTGKPTTIAGYGITDAYTKTQSDAQYQPLDADLTSLAGATLTNSMYYRSATNTWAGVTIGSNLTFGSGTLAAGNVNWDTAYTDRLKWDGGATGLNAVNGRSNLGLVIGTNVQAWGADLDALEALSGTNTIYYRSAVNTWSAVTVGSGLTFAGGTLSSAAGGGDVSSNTSLSVDSEIALFNSTTGKSIKRATGTGIATLASGVLGTITDNSANWNTAATNALRWDGGATGLTPATGRTSLGATNTGGNLFTLVSPTTPSWIKLTSGGTVTTEDAPTTKASLNLDVVTNDVQTKAIIMPNTVPTAGQVPVGNGTAYVPRTISGGAGTTVTFSSTGVLTINGIANGNLANNAIQIGNTASATVLGGTATADQIIGATGLGYVKRTGASAYSATTTSIPNADLANSAMTIATNSTVLGGTVTQDQITGLAGVGLVKHTGANALALAVAGTDYKIGTQNTINVRVVTTTSTYTPTTGVTALYVEGVGGGGGGGGVKESASPCMAAGGGGGGGSYAAVYVATPAASYSVTIGAGGTAGAATGADGGAGGTTTVGAILSAGGGGAGQGCTSLFNPPVYGAAFTAPGSAGGVATIGGLKITGSDGGYGLVIGQPVGGEGGSSVFGGTTHSPAGNGNGNAGANYGGGASGACANSTTGMVGGVGSPGMVRVWEIF